MNPNTATEYRNLPLNVLTESTTNAFDAYLVITARRDGDVALSDRLAEGQSASKPVRREPAKPDGRIANAVDDDKANALADESNQFQSTYTPRSGKKDLSSSVSLYCA